MKREIEGRWWLPEKPNEVFSGTLHYSDDHKLELVIKKFGAFSNFESFDVLKLSSPFSANRVWFGADANNQPISAFHCFESGRSRGEGLIRRTFICSQALVGYHLNSAEEAVSSQVIADFSYLQEWLSISSIRETERMDGGIGIFFQHQEIQPYALRDGSRLSISSSISTIGSGHGKSQWHVDEHHRIRLNLPKPESLSAILDRLTKLRWLLSLLMAEPVQLTSFAVLDRPDEPRNPESGLEREAESIGSHVGRPDDETHLVGRMLLTYQDVREQFADLLNRWSDYLAQIGPVFDLYFTVVFHRGLYTNHRFLFLAQALEVYHRMHFDGKVVPTADFRSRVNRIVASVPESDADWLREKLHFANQKTLAERLNDILAKYPEETHAIVGDPAKFSADVRHTRNGYTHFDKELMESGKVADTNALVPLTDRMQRVLEVCFLRDLGLAGKPIDKVVNRPLPTVVQFNEGSEQAPDLEG